MLLLVLSTLISLISSIKIGHLNSYGAEERNIIQICSNSSEFSIFSAPACNSFIGLDSAAELHHNHNVEYLIGAECDDESQTVSRLAVLWNRQYISPSYASTLIRQNNTISIQPMHPFGVAEAFIALCEYFGWLEIGVLYSTEKQKKATDVIHELENSDSVNLTVEVEMDEYHSLERIISNSRVIFCIGDFSTIRWLVRNLLLNSSRPMEFIIVFIADARFSPREFFTQVNQEIRDFEGKDSTKSARFVENIMMLHSLHPNEAKISQFAMEHKLEKNTVLESSLLLCDGLQLIKHFISNNTGSIRIVEGYSGPLFFSSDGRRLPFFSIFSQGEHSIMEIGRIEPTSNKDNGTSTVEFHTFIPNSQTASVKLRLPPYLPVCGYSGEYCNRSNILAIAIVVICILTVPLSIAFHLQRMQEKKDSPVSSVVQVRDDELRQMRDRLHLLESRVENQEKLNSANMYMLRGFPKKPEETVTVMIVRAFQEVFGMKIDPMSILNVIPVGYDAKMEAPMLKVAFPASLHEKIKLALQGPDNPMKKYNKDNRTSVQCFRSLSSVQLKHFNRSKNAAAMIRQKEAGLLVSVSSENYKIRVGGKGCKWLGLSELVVAYPYVSAALDEKEVSTATNKKRSMAPSGNMPLPKQSRIMASTMEEVEK